MLGKGYLTYAMAVVAIVYGLYDLVVGKNLDQESALTVIWVGLTVFGIRRAM